MSINSLSMAKTIDPDAVSSSCKTMLASIFIQPVTKATTANRAVKIDNFRSLILFTLSWIPPLITADGWRTTHYRGKGTVSGRFCRRGNGDYCFQLPVSARRCPKFPKFTDSVLVRSEEHTSELQSRG